MTFRGKRWEGRGREREREGEAERERRQGEREFPQLAKGGHGKLS
jgi:hypothetical protein